MDIILYSITYVLKFIINSDSTKENLPGRNNENNEDEAQTEENLREDEAQQTGKKISTW